MADGNDQTYSDDNSDGFTTDSDGTWATDDGDTTGDYSDWDWRKIMAAICGGSAYTGDTANTRRAQQYSDPQTLQTAADTLAYVEGVLQEVARAISEQTDALTGEHGPWQGAAATALNGAMTGVARQTQQMADVLSGGVTGDQNVPQQLANDAQNLRDAIAKVNDIDTWYARQAVEVRPDLQMDNGLVMVSKDQQIVTMMSNDMRKVLQTLAQHYTLSKDSVSQPSSPSNPNSPGSPGSSGSPVTSDYGADSGYGSGQYGAVGDGSGYGYGYGYGQDDDGDDFGYGSDGAPDGGGDFADGQDSGGVLGPGGSQDDEYYGGADQDPYGDVGPGEDYGDYGSSQVAPGPRVVVAQQPAPAEQDQTGAAYPTPRLVSVEALPRTGVVGSAAGADQLTPVEGTPRMGVVGSGSGTDQLTPVQETPRMGVVGSASGSDHLTPEEGVARTSPVATTPVAHQLTPEEGVRRPSPVQSFSDGPQLEPVSGRPRTDDRQPEPAGLPGF
ncbi:hypothetical protein K7472_14495 [Streptomyces sp. PTM05]|uniref:Uncharacterized protein n=1 Tax=Streptantibioticus parmotrematis TaxID=2873249 RepID=A0ABS7QS85_9ACTN|nr:WXG100 family type VII secretion target [Streptantibioticus parmotrematis]MBY8886058.1 hypothetical protein [Streptantibioticus parmotrematis]